LKPWTDEANIIGQTIIGSTAVLLDSSNCYDQECNLGSMLADAMVNEVIFTHATKLSSNSLVD
jgi:hypothetical protein